MSEKYLRVDQLSIGKYKKPEEKDEAGLESVETKKINNLSRSQARVIEAGVLALEQPDFIGNLTVDMGGIKLASDAEKFLDTVSIGHFIENFGYDINQINIPHFEKYEDMEAYIKKLEFSMHGDLDQALVFDLLKSLSELIKTYYYKTLKDPEMVNKVFANIFSVFLRRLEYFKKCNQLSRDARKLPYEISADIMNLRNWQKDHIQEVVKPRLPKILEDFPPPLISALNSSVGSVELNLGCTVECDFCAFEPDKTVSSRLPFDEAAWFAINLSNSQASFYKATDPLDYTDPNDSSKDYVELMLVRQAATKSLSYTSTAYPKHSADRLKQMGDGVMRVSVSKMNKKRLVKDGFFEEVGPDIFVPVDPDLADALYFGGTYSFSRFNVRIEEGDGWSGQDLARQVLARNLFSGIGVNKLDENTIVESGRQRDVVAKKTGKPNESISTTISCLDSVVVSPGKIQNIVPMYSTAEYRKGEIGVDIKPENLLDGDRKMLEIFKNFSTGKPTNIKELLPYCLINFSFSSMAQYPAHPMYIEQGHTITFRTFDKNGNFPKTWKCIYNQLNGQVINLVMSFPSNTSEK